MDSKILLGQQAGAYVFDASAKTITIIGLGPLSLENILLATNVTTNVRIFNFNDSTLGGVLSGPPGMQTLTLTFDTTSMADTDDLQIWVVDPSINPNQGHSRDINNEQVVPLGAGEIFNGTFTKVDDVGHFEILYAALVSFTAQKIWSGNGVDDLDRTISDVTTNGTTTITTVTTTFTKYDVGSDITGTNIPASTKILTYVSPREVTMSNAATGSGTNAATLASAFSPSTITQQIVSGYNVAYDLNEGRNTAPYYRLKITNGATPQTAFPGFISIIWLIKNAYQGSFGTLTASLTNLSRALLTRSVMAGIARGSGSFRNVPVTPTDALLVKDEAQIVTPTGSLFVEGITTHVSNIFSRDKGASSIDRMVKVSAAGSLTHDTVQGRAVFATAAVNNEVAYYETDKTLRYDEAAHTLRFELTCEIPQWPLVGTEEILIGAGEDDGAEGVLNGIVHGFDVGGYFIGRIKAGTVVNKVYSTAFNTNPLVAGADSNLFRFSGVGQVLDPSKNNYFFGKFEWLGIAPPIYGVETPNGTPLVVHVEQTPNNISGTIIQEPNVPIFVRIKNDATSGRILQVHTGSIRGGTHENKAIVQGRQPDGDYADSRSDGIAVDVSSIPVQTSTPLTAGSNYTSGWVDTDGWAAAELFVATDQVSAGDGIEIEFTDDTGAAIPVERGNRLYTFTAADVAKGSQTFRFPTELDGLRIKYTNGGTGQGSFLLVLTLRVQAVNPQGGVEGSFGPTNTTIMTRGVVVAKNASNVYGNIERGTSGGLDVGIVQHEVETPIKSLAGLKVTRTSITTVAAKIVSTPLANRRSLGIKAICSGSALIYLGTTSAVTAGTGHPLSDGQSVDMELDETVTEIWAIASTGTQAVSTIEVSL